MDERERIIRAFLPLVRRMAKRVARLVPSMDVEDLIGEGCVGLIRAVDGFDPTFGTTLEHYVRRLALGKMLNGVRRMDRVSERARRELRDAERQRYETASTHGTLPSDAELERARPRYAAARLQQYIAMPLSLDCKLPEAMEPPVDWGSDPAIVLERRQQGEELRAMIASLTPRQQEVIALHYVGHRTLGEVGARFGISAQRASQIHVAAVAKLRKIAHAAPH